MADQSIERLVHPEDIAAFSVFLAPDAAKSISGQLLPIDGDYQPIDRSANELVGIAALVTNWRFYAR